MCLDTHYQDGQVCLDRAPPGEPCTGLNQCVQDAECDLTLPTDSLCKCNSGFYRNGRECRTLIDAGKECELENSCTANSQCTVGLGQKVRIASNFYFRF